MLQPHSFLWHYLWVGPGLLLGSLAVLSWRKGFAKLSPAFFVYLAFESFQGLALYAMDLLPQVSASAYWRAVFGGMVIELFVKLAVIWEIFSHLVAPRPALARSGRRSICWLGVVLGLLAVAAASQAHIRAFAILSYCQVLGQGIYLVEAGLLLYIFFFAGHFQLAWSRRDFGIALGLSISACVGLGVLAIYASGASFARLYLLDFLNMATYHGCVLIWFYYLLTPWQPMKGSGHDRAVATTDDDGFPPTLRKLWPAWLVAP